PLEMRAEAANGSVPGGKSDAHGGERATGGGVYTQKTSTAIEEQQSARRESREPLHTRLEQVLPQLHLSRCELRFDSSGRHHRQREEIAVERAAEPRDVHHSYHFATGWIAHDGRRACPRLDSSAEVLCRVDLDRLSDG